MNEKLKEGVFFNAALRVFSRHSMSQHNSIYQWTESVGNMFAGQIVQFTSQNF